MVLEYLPTKLGQFGGFYVGKYSSTMGHLGLIIIDISLKVQHFYAKWSMKLDDSPVKNGAFHSDARLLEGAQISGLY